jgi:anti-sigma factor RsiW
VNRPERCPTIAELAAYQDGDVNERQLRRVRYHVDSCARCQRELVALLNTAAALVALPTPQLPSDIWHAVTERLTDEKRRPAVLVPRLALGIGLATLAVVGVLALSRPAPLPPVPASHVVYVTDHQFLGSGDPLTDRVALGVELAGWQEGTR